jgi:prepilin-type N-terminal cleavage/methylation domain-containing protein
MRRGFTLIELAVSLSILALLVPLVFMMGRSFEEHAFQAAAQAEAAAAMRSVSEELRRDLKTMGWPDDTALKLAGAGQCPSVEYKLNADSTLVREGAEGCGPARTIAANVRSISRETGGLRVVFFKRVAAGRERTDTFIMGFGE